MICQFCSKPSIFTSYVPFETVKPRGHETEGSRWMERITVQHEDGTTCVREEERGSEPEIH